MTTPIGTIVAWAGNPATLDANWKICDGTQISFHMFPDLCSVLQDYWGPIGGNNHDLYTLPNLQGVFLRGVNQGRSDEFSDPDHDRRVAAVPGPGRSNQVGSLQRDDSRNHAHELKDDGHTHRFTYRTEGSGPNSGDGGKDIGYRMFDVRDTESSKTGISMSPAGGRPNGGLETRPPNAYVYWIIRAK